MCGRYTTVESKKLYQRYGVKTPLEHELPASYNLAPGQSAPIVTGDHTNKLELMRWGFLPSWAKDEKMAYRTINARAESLLEKPMWASAYRKARCLVPASGFYEWQKTTGQKRQPFYIHLPKQEIFSFAGLYSYWHDPSGEERATFTIITTEPNKEIEPIHDRMPVILDKDEETAWLDPKNQPADLQPLLNSYEGKLYISRVSLAVNSPANNTADLIKPVV